MLLVVDVWTLTILCVYIHLHDIFVVFQDGTNILLHFFMDTFVYTFHAVVSWCVDMCTCI